MITDETTPDLLRQAAAEWVGDTTSDHYARHGLRARADRLEREQGLLPIRPGWYQNIVVESGEEKFRGGGGDVRGGKQVVEDSQGGQRVKRSLANR